MSQPWSGPEAWHVCAQVPRQEVPETKAPGPALQCRCFHQEPPGSAVAGWRHARETAPYAARPGKTLAQATPLEGEGGRGAATAHAAAATLPRTACQHAMRTARRDALAPHPIPEMKTTSCGGRRCRRAAGSARADRQQLAGERSQRASSAHPQDYESRGAHYDWKEQGRRVNHASRGQHLTHVQCDQATC
jgi:hypothetical protein